MKSPVSVAAAALLLLLSPALAGAQAARSRRATAPAQKRRGAAARPSRAGSESAALARARVAERIKLITEFLYVYGGVANEIERTEGEARAAGRGGAELTSLAERSRTTLRRSLGDVRAGLDQLELDFRSTPELRRYYDRLGGVAAAAADAEELAGANRLKDAGRKLLSVVGRLTDTLAAMD